MKTAEEILESNCMTEVKSTGTVWHTAKRDTLVEIMKEYVSQETAQLRAALVTRDGNLTSKILFQENEKLKAALTDMISIAEFYYPKEFTKAKKERERIENARKLIQPNDSTQ